MLDGLNIEFGKYNNGSGKMGYEIQVEYTPGEDVSKAYWEQYIQTNKPKNQPIQKKIVGAWDDDDTHNHKYYTNEEMKNQITNNGKTVTFYDCPTRSVEGAYWKGNLYLMNNNQVYLKIYYSFQIKNNVVTISPINIIRYKYK